jgi:DNA (cytosine-5)-methyltransferase 1
LNYGSVCSGVEAATVAWEGLGWKPQWFSEIEQFPSAVLNHHYPNIPNMGDMTNYKDWNNASIELLVGGTPCQSFSVAGLRKGLDDPRGNLMLTYLAIAEQYRAKWLVWENVPGVLSSNGGKDFGAFLGALGQLGYGFAYRVLDAQYFGVPQRRKRVFVVGCLGDWRSAAAVLFESHSLQGHSAPSREKGEKVAPAVTTGPPFSRTGNERVECDAIIPFDTTQITSPANRSHPKPGDPCHPLAAGAHAPAIIPIAFGGQMSNVQTDAELSQTLQAKNPQAVMTARMGGFGDYVSDDTASCVKARDYKDATDLVAKATGESTLSDVTMSITAGYGTGGADLATKPMVCENAVRRLTPTECERLQGFPDNYTKIPYRKKDADNCPDGPRYKAMGNSMAVPVMKWIGQRIEMVDQMTGK